VQKDQKIAAFGSSYADLVHMQNGRHTQIL
jgi:hypothetical protein